MKTSHKCIIGDARRMAEVNDASVHLIVTSPPYWQLKDYGTAEQLGFNDSYEEYINNLNLVWNDCYRVLHPGCRLVVNIGDQFARSVYYGRYKVIPIRTEIIRFCETVGFDYMGAIIWQKKTTMNTTGGATVMGSYPYPRNGIVEIDYEFILIFKKPGQGPKVDKSVKAQSLIPRNKWKEYFLGHWNFNGARQDGHIAMFPLELPKRAIEMFTFVGETVLDPFLGSGTTSLAAIISERNSIGYEINRRFLPVIKKKLSAERSKRFSDFEFRVEEQAAGAIDWAAERRKLPYIFTDPVHVEKKVDPRTRRYGSKISAGDAAADLGREALFTVTKIIDTNKILLSDGRAIQLLGVKPAGRCRAQAREFLGKKLLGRQIFLKFDSCKEGPHGALLAYVYMKNKTFINAHLLKHGLADVDDSFAFRHKQKFTRLALLSSPSTA